MYTYTLNDHVRKIKLYFWYRNEGLLGYTRVKAIKMMCPNYILEFRKKTNVH